MTTMIDRYPRVSEVANADQAALCESAAGMDSPGMLNPIERAIAAMRDKPGAPWTLKLLAKIANYSPYHFVRLFQEAVGITPGQYLTAARIEASKTLVAATSANILDICYDVGYASMGSFSSQFSNLVGVSPRQFRTYAKQPGTPVDLSVHASNSDFFESRVGAFTLHGNVSCPDNPSPVLVGLYEKPIPSGMPLSCGLIEKPGRFEVPVQSSGVFHLFVVAFDSPNDVGSAILDVDRIWVGRADEPISVKRGMVLARPHIRLRRWRITDPPILSALGCLFDAQERAPESAAQETLDGGCATEILT